jgi:hypothetical protein
MNEDRADAYEEQRESDKNDSPERGAGESFAEPCRHIAVRHSLPILVPTEVPSIVRSSRRPALPGSSLTGLQAYGRTGT